MEILAVLLLLYLFLALVVFPIWALTRLNELGHATRSLRSQLGDLRDQILSLRAAVNRRPEEPAVATTQPAAPPAEASAAVIPPAPVVIELPIPPAPVDL